MAKKETHIADPVVGQGKTLAEHGSQEGIEKQSEDVTENNVLLEKEAFMNDLLTVLVAQDGTPGAYDVITPSVNGVNQPIILGRKQEIKRKYVEVLARSRLTSYNQVTPDPTRPENFLMVPTTVPTHPFSVLNDPHPDGAVWLQSILAQP